MVTHEEEQTGPGAGGGAGNNCWQDAVQQAMGLLGG
jgi:hypothetical protein